MATSQEAICRLVKDRTMELETEIGSEPEYNGVVGIEDTLLVIDDAECNLQLYSCRDGKLLTKSHTFESIPTGVCMISKTEVAVCLLDSTIEILSFKSVDVLKRVKTVNVSTGFHGCHSVAKVNSSYKLVISGEKYSDDDEWECDDGMMLCWGVVSIINCRVDSTQNICKGYGSQVAIKDNTVYISCRTFESSTNGVYAYDIFNPNTHKFIYQHHELKSPGPIMADWNSIFVIDYDSNRIHQLTDSGKLVTINTVSSSLFEIFYDDQRGIIYTTRNGSNMITVYRLEYLHQPGIPIEILNMDQRSIQLFEEALKSGKEKVYNIRLMVVGHMGVGKTTLVKRLLGQKVQISKRRDTEGIDIYVNCCDVSLSTYEWTRRTKDIGQNHRLQRIARVLNEQQSIKENVVVKDQSLIPPHVEKPLKSLDGNLVDVEHKTIEVLYRRSAQQDIGQDLSFTASQQDFGQDNSSTTSQQNIVKDLSSSDSQQQGSPSTFIEMTTTQSETNTIAMLKLLKENVNKLESLDKYSLMTIWDFAGQNAFYTTHQTFLTRRAIYLLVFDVSGHATDIVADDCYFDSEGITKCKVHELIEVWLNSIHSCASSHEASNPPVILVGTHVDKISQNPLIPHLKAVDHNLMLSLMTIMNDHLDAASKGNDKKLSLTKYKDSKTQITGSETEELTSPTTSTLNSDAASEKSRTVKKFVQSRKTDGIVEDSPVSSLTGGHALPAKAHLKNKRKRSWRKLTKKKKRKTAVMPIPSNEEPVGETIMSVDAEKGNHNEICERYFREIRSYLKDKPTRFHLIDEDFAVDNTIIDRKLDNLKKKIVEVASQQPYWGEEIPARWLPLEQELMKRKDAGVKVISRENVDTINKEGTVRIEKSEELDLFLRFLHETGTIIYFSIEVLRENIVLDPSWLIDALKLLINAHTDLPEYSADSTVTQKWSDFKEKGILSLELIDAIWTKEIHPELHVHRYHILLLMEQLNIIAKPRTFSEIGEKVEENFLTPCMLRQESPKDVISPENDPRLVSTPDMRYIFTGKYLPSPIFHRLLAACVARWPVAKKKETSQNLILCGCCVFDLDLFHRLTVYIKNHVVFARITRMVIDDVKIPDGNLCSRVRRFITLNLSKITSYLGQNLQYELCVQCPPFQMWHAEEGHNPDAPITPEHMNHARLCVALVTVCGNALRDILLTNFPVPYKDIYQAILANRANLTRRQGRPLLSPAQIQLVFPDPQGQITGTVDHFDVSLLYTLIRNISTVTAPVTGWGNDPQDQPRDTSLGASVERIRSYRNHISGHSPDGKISRQDLEDYWKRLEAVIHDIEYILGGYAYSQDLEKQRRQVISTYEAC